jgi:hypothetical protein
VAMTDGKMSPGVDVQMLPAQSGNVTTLDGSAVTTFPSGAQFASQPNGNAGGNWGGWPVVMPQPSIIVVTVDKNGAKNEGTGKSDSEVFKRL